MPTLQVEWKLDIGTILTLLTLAGTGAVWLFRRLNGLFGAIAEVQKDVAELKNGQGENATINKATRAEVDALSHRMTRLETCMELVVTGQITDPAIRGVARDVARRREGGQVGPQ